MVVRIYTAILHPENPECQHVLWPERMTYDWLMWTKALSDDATFATQYLNDASLMLGNRYLESWLQLIDIEDIDLTKLRGYQYADPATSIKDTADDFAIATGGLTEDNLFILLGVVKAKVAPADHYDYVVSNFRYWKNQGLDIHTAWIEEVGAQQGTSQRLIQEVRHIMPLEAHPVNRSTGSKRERIDRTMPFIKNGFIKFIAVKLENLDLEDPLHLHPNLEDFLKQYKSYPRGKDDVIDSVAGLINKVAEVPPAYGETIQDNPISRETNNPYLRNVERRFTYKEYRNRNTNNRSSKMSRMRQITRQNNRNHGDDTYENA